MSFVKSLLLATNLLPKSSSISDNLKYQVHSVKKLACEKALGKPSHVCDSMITETYPMQSINAFMQEDRFVFDVEKKI
jgi:hypothetical protein